MIWECGFAAVMILVEFIPLETVYLSDYHLFIMLT
jgi:hypothetical protein